MAPEDTEMLVTKHVTTTSKVSVTGVTPVGKRGEATARVKVYVFALPGNALVS